MVACVYCTCVWGRQKERGVARLREREREREGAGDDGCHVTSVFWLGLDLRELISCWKGNYTIRSWHEKDRLQAEN